MPELARVNGVIVPALEWERRHWQGAVAALPALRRDGFGGRIQAYTTAAMILSDSS